MVEAEIGSESGVEVGFGVWSETRCSDVDFDEVDFDFGFDIVKEEVEGDSFAWC